MILHIRKSSLFKKCSVILSSIFLYSIVYPTASYALTGGPSQPEVMSFEPVGTSEMVDLASGDFTYNIPLIDVEGYPINLSYHSGISMDQEASWVGLGWNINPGVINRNMRSLPDDFNGDEIKKEFNVKRNETYGARGDFSLELIGLELKNIGVNLGFGMNASYNNYTGVGLEMSFNPSLSSGKRSKTKKTVGLGMSAGTNGVGLSPQVSFSKNVEDSENSQSKIGGSVGLSYNSRAGLQSINIGASYQKTRQESVKRKGKETKKERTRGSNGGSSISFSTPSYTPQLNMSMFNSSVSIGFTFGGEIYGTHVNGMVTGYYAGQYLLSKEDNVPAFGYMYSHESVGHDKMLLDFNREKEGGFTESTPNLPITNFSYDVFSVAGQGIGGMYRPFRSDIGIVSDNEVKSISAGMDLGGIELGMGNTARGGVNVTADVTNSVSGKWTSDNAAWPLLQFKSSRSGDPTYEPFYFKQAGEKTADSDPSFYNRVGNDQAVRLGLNGNLQDVPATGQFIAGDGSTLSVPSDNQRNKRQRRNEMISILNAAEASDYALEKKIKSYPLNTFNINTSGSYTGETEILRSEHNNSHISEITAIRADGARYIYGIPAYNNTQKEVSFAITGGDPNCTTGLVEYNSGTDDTKNNKKGLDHFYSNTIMPEYAHSYLLTSILSNDYVDVDDNGPTDNDLGNYTKFNYTKAYSDYKWRVPYESGKANYSEGLRTKKNTDAKGDDKGSYIYGEKEIWYLHSIESKSYVAEFTLESRTDGLEVSGESGGTGTNSTKRLKKIDLFSKEDKIKNGSNAIPIKSVHFVYSYSLCQGISNGSSGKLTLDKVYFTYGNSKRGQLSPYEFTYGEHRKEDGTVTSVNPSYNLKGYDRWGNYKPNATACNSNVLTNAEYPYVDQRPLPSNDAYYDIDDPMQTYTDVYAYAWNLTKIELPSGGVIKVNYESDDYAFVQDKRAMQMFRVVGSSSDVPGMSGWSNFLYNNSVLDKSPYNYLVLELPNSYSVTSTPDDFKRDFLVDEKGHNIDRMFFRFLVDLAGVSGEAEEFVNGYVPLDFTPGSYGFIQNSGSDFTHAFIRIKPLTASEGFTAATSVNRISLAAWNFTKLYLPRIAYNTPDVNNNAIIQVLEALAATLTSLTQFIAGTNTILREANHAQDFSTSKSWVRLYNPDGFKQGGGVRVKRIEMTDEWKSIAGVSSYKDASYGQEYEYTDEDKYGNIISSGVATYEPTVGGEENPFRQPVFFSEEKLLVPDIDHYMETPFGESFFPAASVVYGKVTVKNLQHTNVTQNATGKVVHEFYTAKDFPTITKQTALEPIRKKPNPLLSFLKIKAEDYMTASQGYMVELNDMAGKPKAQWNYAEGKQHPFSGIEYKYKQKGSQQLDNEVLTISKEGTVQKEDVGIDFDFIVDMREQKTEITNTGTNGSLDGFLASVLPIALPMLMPSYSEEKTRFRSAVTTKVINKYGILEKTITHDEGAVVVNENILYDKETGEVLLTKSENEFEDPIYSFTYPAHWSYFNMGPASNRTGMVLDAGSYNLQNYLQIGDEIGVNGDRLWVVPTSGKLKLMDENGNRIQVPSSGDVIVLRTAERNLQSTSVGNIVCKKDPLRDINSDGIPDELNFEEILDAQMIEFTDESGAFCECNLSAGDVVNPYTVGIRGNWKPKKNNKFLTDRIQQFTNGNTSVRTDGIYSNYNTFWVPNNGNDWATSTIGWSSVVQSTSFSPNGPEIENVDLLNRFKAVSYGYGQTLPTAIGSNTQYRELAFDGFEDYDFENCADDHFNFKEQVAQYLGTNVIVTNYHSHTGKNSIQINPGYGVSVEKTIDECE